MEGGIGLCVGFVVYGVDFYVWEIVGIVEVVDCVCGYWVGEVGWEIGVWDYVDFGCEDVFVIVIFDFVVIGKVMVFVGDYYVVIVVGV